MTNVPVKLNEEVHVYPFFEDNQVLTAAQLNTVVKYFDYQQRLTRTRLSGCGIVCGLKLFSLKGVLTVTKGVAVTSDGDMIALQEDAPYTGIKPLDDRKAKYSFFAGLAEQEGRIWELVPSKVITADEDVIPITAFAESNNLNEFVCLIYLAQYLEDTDICSSDECDNKGIIQQSDMKVIIMSRKDYQSIATTPACCDLPFDAFPDACVEKVFLNENDALFSYNDLQNAYKSVLQNIAKTGSHINVSLAAADAMAADLYNCYNSNGNVPMVFKTRRTTRTLAAENLVTGNFSTAGKFQQLLNSAVSANVIPNVQYLYDFVKDIADACNEFKDHSFELCSGCCIDPGLFPKHICLGIAAGISEDNKIEVEEFRHCFIESPILNHRDKELLHALRLYSRLVQMLESFSVPASNAAIKITPSKSIYETISKRSIPYYYQPAVSQNWDPEKTERKQTATIPGYQSPAYSSLPQVTEPLKFNTDPYPFFRIEGHVGKTVSVAAAAINSFRNQFDLPFDLVTVQLQTERITIFPPIRPPKFNWWDILNHTQIHAWTTKLDYLKNHNDEIVTQRMPADSELQVAGISIPFSNTQAFKTDLINNKNAIDTHITTAKQSMAAAVPGATNFTQLHATMANAGAQMSKHTKLFTSAAVATPLETFHQATHPKILDWLHDFKTKVDDKVKDGYVFSNFLKNNPGMQHNAGVPTGGTFILVYNTVNNVSTVVADFYLPYIAKEDYVDKHVDATTIPVRPFLPINHLNIKDFIKRPLYNPDLIKLGDDLTVKANEFTMIKTNFTDLQQHVNENVFKTFDNYQKSYGSLVGAYENIYTKSIKGIAAAAPNATEILEFVKTMKPEDVAGFTKEEAVKLRDNVTNVIKEKFNI